MADGGAVGPGVSSQAGSCSLEVCSKLHTSAGVLRYSRHTVCCIHPSRVLHKQIVHYFFFSFLFMITYLLSNYSQVNCEPLLLLEKNAQDFKQQSIALEPNTQRNIDT